MPRRARWCAASRVMSRPPNVTRPARRGRRPMMLSMVVVFPAPLRPTRQTASRSPTVSDTARRTWAGPRKVSMRSSSSMGGPEQVDGDRLVDADLGWGSVGQDRALMHGDDPVGIVEDDVHVVLDDRRRDALA